MVLPIDTMHTFILAGGFATRLWPLTEKRAKPLLPLAGTPIISYPVQQLPKDMPVTVSTNNVFKEGFEQWKQENDFSNAEVLIEDTKSDDHKLGALGAVAQWVNDQQIDDDVLLIAGDNYCGFSLTDFIAAYDRRPLVAAYDIKDLNEAKLFGTVILEPGSSQVQAFEEKPKEPKTTLVSTGCSVLPKETLPVLLEYAKEHPDNIGGIFEEFLRRNIQVDCFTFADPWFDIGSFGAYLEATKKLVGSSVKSGEGSSYDTSEMEESVVLGANSQVHESQLKNVVIFDNCTITDCILEDCIIDNNTVMKGIDLTGKMLREGTVLKRN